MYWVYWGTDANGSPYAPGVVNRANLNGTSRTKIPNTYGDESSGLAVDASHIYWTSDYHGAVYRANLDGSARKWLPDVGGGALAVDAHYLYCSGIGRAHLDGTHAQPRFIRTTSGPQDGLAVDTRGPRPRR